MKADSIYSASAAAREEFPDQDVTVRGAVSIGRRLMDPLAELVKIDAKILVLVSISMMSTSQALNQALTVLWKAASIASG